MTKKKALLLERRGSGLPDDEKNGARNYQSESAADTVCEGKIGIEEFQGLTFFINPAKIQIKVIITPLKYVHSSCIGTLNETVL